MLQDLKYALRSLRKNPGFAAVAVLTLALGIGGGTAVFSLVNGILLQSLPYPEHERLVVMRVANPERGVAGAPVSLPDFRDWREEAGLLDGMAAYPFFSFGGLVLLGRGEPVELNTGYVSVEFFDVLGVRARHGRTFRPDEDMDGFNRVVVLSDGLWRRRFGADPEIVGRTITLDGAPHTVIGIAPPETHLPAADVEIWAPLSLIDSTRIPHHIRAVRWLTVVARRRAGVSERAVTAEMHTIAARLADAYPDANGGWEEVRLVPLRQEVVGDVQPALLILLGSVGLLLLIACANVANLLLARGMGRQRELAVRAALGAGRWRMVRQLLTESVLLGVLAGAIGFLAATWGLDAMVAFAGERLPRATEIHIDRWVFGFAALVSLAAGLVFGVLPAWSVTKDATGPSVHEGGRAAGNRRTRRLRKGLVASELALAMTLLVGAGLLITSLWRMASVDPGFDFQKVLAVEFVIPTPAYPEREQYRAVYDAVLERLAGTAGVRAVGAAQILPGTGRDELIEFSVPGVPPPRGEDEHSALWRAVSPGYFEALGIPILRGRPFGHRDAAEAPMVAIVSRALAERLWPDENAVGRRIEEGSTVVEIVGVVGDVRYGGLRSAPEPVLYRPHAQQSRRRVALVVETEPEQQAMVSVVRDAIWAVDPNQPIRRVEPMSDVLASSLAESRFLTTVMAAFACLALILAAVGLYGVIAQGVSQRAREIGVRVALGARRADIRRLVIGEALRVTAIGLVAGMGGAFLLARVLASQLFGVGVADPRTFVGVAVVLSLVALSAAYLPARRAARTDPVEALRYE